MREFLTTERLDPTKRLAVERTRDFGEIYEVFNHYDASSQSERCIQCGDPYCLNKCPLHNYIPQWLKSIAEKDLEFAFKLSNEPSPFPEVMGRVCPHDRLCEGDCSLNDGHGAITIGSIETHITEEGFKQGFKPDFPGITTGKKVAVIGSGPAGLSCATYLLRSGIAVTMYERSDRVNPGFHYANIAFLRLRVACSILDFTAGMLICSRSDTSLWEYPRSRSSVTLRCAGISSAILVRSLNLSRLANLGST